MCLHRGEGGKIRSADAAGRMAKSAFAYSNVADAILIHRDVEE